MMERALEELEGILLQHARTYPEMDPCDAVKLIYQNEFGVGHLIGAPEESLERLRREYVAVVHAPSVPVVEEIGNGMVRILLAGLDIREYPPEELNEDLVRSARQDRGDRNRFYRKLEVLRVLAERGVFSFSRPELEEYLRDESRVGEGPVSHSPRYRAAYHPAYRVVRRRAAVGLLVRQILQLASVRPRVLVALDGRCAAGKTTLAGHLSARYGWGVVHMDHFFLRPEQQTPERYRTPGENVDHERFLEQVLRPLRAGEQVEYRPYDCHTRDFGAPVRVDPGPVVLVEGSYSCHRALWDYYDLRVFLTVPPEEQLSRIGVRNGADQLAAFRERWIPLEEGYFTAERLDRRCQMTLEL